jgi:flagellar biosynthesis/type III secretory pathway chaperone
LSYLDQYRALLTALTDLMQQELDAIEAGDLARVHEVTDEKLGLVRRICQAGEHHGIDPELRTLVSECAALNARAALRAYLLLTAQEQPDWELPWASRKPTSPEAARRSSHSARLRSPAGNA